MKYYKIAGLILAAVAISYAFIQQNWPTYSWNQKLTVTVNTPEGEFSGSSVIKVVWQKRMKFIPDMAGVTHREYGEATVVSLPNGRYLFALIRNAGYIPLRVFAEGMLPKQQPTASESFLPAASEVSRSSGQVRVLQRARIHYSSRLGTATTRKQLKLLIRLT